jgi:hypothetical protein
MGTPFSVTRTQVILGLCVPLAVLLGYVLAEPLQVGSLMVLALLAALLISPLLLRWHYPTLVLSWNAALVMGFLPGRPEFWMLTAFLSLLVTVLTRSVSERHPFQQVRALTLPLLTLAMVVIFTALLTGGIGIRSLGGSTYGGRYYVLLLAAIGGYFALSSHNVPVRRATVYTGMFFLPGLTALLPNIAYAAGSSFWWMFQILPGTYAWEQAKADYLLNMDIVRIAGFGPASMGLLCWLLARYGIEGLFVWQRPWRMGLFLGAAAMCLMAGYRSILALFLLVLLIQFFLEGLHRTRLLPLTAGVGALLLVLLLARPSALPMSVQRSLSFLPIEISHAARSSAEHSTEWRIEMWKAILPDVPRYLLLGKGYSIDPNELGMAMESAYRGLAGGYVGSSTAGDYHNGLLTIIVPFGLWGMLAFGWFLVAGVRYLYSGYRHGNPRLRRVNTLLLSLFLARTVSFVLVVGAFAIDMAVFAGILGFAVCLNGPNGSKGSPGSVAVSPASVSTRNTRDTNSA